MSTTPALDAAIEWTRKALDRVTWDAAYDKGYRVPNHPVPAIVYEVEFYPDPLIEIVEVVGERHCYLSVRFQEPMPWITESKEYVEVIPGMYYPAEGCDAGISSCD
jgi:hypothetical protein